MAHTAGQRARADLDLVHQYLPHDVESAGEFDDWNVVGPGLIAAAAVILESIFRLPPVRSRPSAEILARSVFEYAITFAWLAAPEDEVDRALRLARFEVDEYHARETVDKRYVSVLADKRKRYEADDRWFDEVKAVECIPFAHVYGLGYSDYSFVSHPSPTAVSRVVTGRDGILRVGEPVGDDHRISLVGLGLCRHARDRQPHPRMASRSGCVPGRDVRLTAVV